MEASSFNANKPSASSPSSALESIQAKLNEIKRTKKVGKRKDGRPLRPLSAYNIFFQLERNKIMKEQADLSARHATGGIGNLATRISAKWKKVDTAMRMELDAMAKLDRERYDRENEEWKLNTLRIVEPEAAKAEAIYKDVFVEEIVIDNGVSRGVSPLGFDSPLASFRQTVTRAAAVPSLPLQTNQGFVHAPCFPLDNDASPVKFARIEKPAHHNFFSFSSLEQGAHHITPDSQLLRPNLQLAPHVEASGFTLKRRSSCGNFEGDMYATDVPPSARRRHSCEAAAYCNEDTSYMRGYVQGFKKSGFASRRISNVDCSDDTNNVYSQQISDQTPEYMRGYTEGFKAASEMWAMMGV